MSKCVVHVWCEISVRMYPCSDASVFRMFVCVPLLRCGHAVPLSPLVCTVDALLYLSFFAQHISSSS